MLKDVYTLEDLQHWQAAAAGIQPPIRLAVIGDPISHSASPLMHNAALAKCGIAATYTRLQLRPEQLASGLELLKGIDFIGLNVTIPHKTAMLPLVDRLDDHAGKLGAVNTVAFQKGQIVGFNTDGPGLVRAIRAEFGVDVRELRVMVLGAGGGAGRAIAVQCALEGCQRLVLVNRTMEKASRLREEIAGLVDCPKAEAVPWEAIQTDQVDLVMNATSMGMKPGDASPLPASLLRPDLMVYDTIYTSHRTPLMLAADAAGAKSANGFSMLLHQGALAFEIWFGQPAPLEEMRAALL